MNDKLKHFFAGSGIWLGVSLSLNIFGGPSVKYEDTRAPAYGVVAFVAIAKEVRDENRAPKSNDAKEHALDIGATVLGAIAIDALVRSLFTAKAGK